MEKIPEDDRIERATEATTMGELKVGDLVPGWFGLCRVTVSEPRADGWHHLEFAGREEYGIEASHHTAPWRRVPAGELQEGDGSATAALS